MVGGGVGGYCVGGRAQRRTGGRGGLYEHRELGLPTRPFQVDDQRPGHISDHLRSVVILDQRQRQIDARGNPGRGENIGVPDEYRIRLDGDVGECALQQAGVAPMSGGPAMVEHTRLGQQKRSGAYRRDASAARLQLGQGGHQSGVQRASDQYVAARDQHGIGALD
ncbi:Uncharacterised protein [Mycobacteroides abscessus subsp. abscessus]|nr:Uncharacterised protein [Mycobacteroides abscessus subsp. abscessus]